LNLKHYFNVKVNWFKKKKTKKKSNQPFFEGLKCELEKFFLQVFTLLDQLNYLLRLAQVPLQYEHFLIRLLFVFAVFARLHFLSAPPKHQVGIVWRTHHARLVRENDRCEWMFLFYLCKR